MSMSDDDLNALLAAWAQEDGTADGGNEMSEALAQLSNDESETFTALISQQMSGGGNKSGWPDNGQKGSGKREYGKSKSASPQRIAQGEPIYFGRVKTYDKDKNRGYIACDEVGAMCGMDVYVYGDVLASAGAGPGDGVAFFIHWSKQGQPQASAPLFRLSGAGTGGYALRGEFKPGSASGNGFIMCEDIKEFFGRDVFCPKEMAAVLQAGQTVAFNAVLNAQKFPQVDGLEQCPPDWEPELGDLSNSRTDPTVQSKLNLENKGANKGGWSKGAGKDSGKDSGKDLGSGKDSWGGDGGCKGKGKGKEGKLALMMEVMKLISGDWDDWGGDGNDGSSWGGDGGLGLPGKGAAADTSKPAWIQAAKNLSGGGASVGGWTSGWDSPGCGSKGKGGWNSGWGDSGKSSGKDKGSGEGGGIPTPSGDTFYGVIKTFNQKNNYGFIASEQIQEKYNGVDCFFHGKFFEGHNVGDMVEFDVGLNNKGQPQAMAIRAFTLPDELNMGEEEPSPKKIKLV